MHKLRNGYNIRGMIQVATRIDKRMAGKEFLSTVEAADYLGLDKDTLRHYCQGENPRIKAEKFGRDWMIPKSEVERYDRERREYNKQAIS